MDDTTIPSEQETLKYMEQRFELIIAKLIESDPNADTALVREAYEFALAAHSGQKRKSGEPYAIHPVEVALIVAEINLDADSIVAAMLHDTIEDTGYGYADIKTRFNTAVADLVDGVTKLTRTSFSSKEEQQMENLRKMFLAMAKDIRVILIKICDRLHNMRTSEYWSERTRREKSRETMEIYAPLAHRLGMQKIKWELEDLALKNLDPVAYGDIMQSLKEKENQHTDFLSHIQATIKARLEEVGISASIEGRIKHIYSIYRKMYTQHKALFEIYDLYAVRVIVNDLTDCYNVLGFIHDLYKPIPGRFKDYISTPKPNMYQSLHTTVIGREGVPFEVQIRDWEMHGTAEMGIAAHWRYKDGIKGDTRMTEKLAWVRGLLESQLDTEAEDFISTIKVDMFADEVFVFTPRGKVINLPTGAGIIDFAYAIHSAVGNRMMGAKVNGRMVNLEYQLQNGDIVEIITGNTHGPSRDWLKMVKTSEARSKIKQWFKKERRDENVMQGKQDFERELKRAGIALSTVMQEEILPVVLKKMSFAALEDMYAAIGFSGLSPLRAINRFRDELIRVNKAGAMTAAAQLEKLTTQAKKPTKALSGVIVEGIDNCPVKISRCCMPVPGDEIVGFVTRGYGVSIHRADCTNTGQMQTNADPSRWIHVYWAQDTGTKFKTDLQLIAHDRSALLMDVMTALNSTHFPILTLNAKSLGDGYAQISLTAEVSGQDQIEFLRNKLQNVRGVMNVTRQ